MRQMADRYSGKVPWATSASVGSLSGSSADALYPPATRSASPTRQVHLSKPSQSPVDGARESRRSVEYSRYALVFSHELFCLEATLLPWA